MANFNVLSLADIYDSVNRNVGARTQNQMNALKLAEMGQQIQAERALSDLLSNSVQTVGGSPAVPDQPFPDGSGKVLPGRPEVPGRAELSWDKAFSQIPDIDPRLRGKAVLEIQKMRMAEEMKRMEIAAKMREGGGFEGPVLPGEDGKYYRATKAGPLVEVPVAGGAKLDFGFVPVTETDPVTLEQRIVFRPRKGGGPQAAALGPDVNKEKDDVTKTYYEKRMPELDDYVVRLDKRIKNNPELAPGIGGKNPLSRLASSKEGQQFISDIQALVGTSIAKNAGLSQTESEARRVMNMFASSDLHTVEEFKYAFDRFKKTYAAERRALFAKSPRASKYLKETINVDLEKAPWENNGGGQNILDKYGIKG